MITTRASAYAVAHEIGHACGLKDIYVGKCPFPIAENALVEKDWVPNDWAGGYGGLKHRELIIKRLLMYGVASATPGYDIPAGTVWGEYKAGAGMYDKKNAEVGGTINGDRNPTHN